MGNSTDFIGNMVCGYICYFFLSDFRRIQILTEFRQFFRLIPNCFNVHWKISTNLWQLFCLGKSVRNPLKFDLNFLAIENSSKITLFSCRVVSTFWLLLLLSKCCFQHAKYLHSCLLILNVRFKNLVLVNIESDKKTKKANIPFSLEVLNVSF